MIRRPPVRVAMLTAALALTGAMTALLLPHVGTGTAPWWVWAAAFALTEAVALQLRARRGAELISLSEVPLVFGLFLAQPGPLLLGRVLGSGLVFALLRRDPPLKVAFNTALGAAGTAIAVAALSLSPAHGISLVAMGFALIGLALAGAIEECSIAVVLGWYGGPSSGRDVLRGIGVAASTSMGVGALGLLALLMLHWGTAALPLAGVGVAALLGYRAFAALAQRHSGLERLYGLSDALAAAPGPADVIDAVLHDCADLLRATHAELVLIDSGSPSRANVERWVLTAEDGVATAEVDDALNARVSSAATSGPQLLRPSTDRRFLETRGISDGLLVPIRVDARISGFLLVGGRAGERRGFTAADGRLLETVANHACVALRNGRLIQRLAFEARHDELTGLPNRKMFRDLLDQAALAAATDGGDCTVMVLDFDGFKAINDTLGHPVGDELLRVLADRLRQAAGSQALVARLGGDEFAVLATRSGSEGAALDLAERLLAVFDTPVLVAGARLRLGGSLGIALAPQHGRTGSDLMRNADIAMYAAKAGAGGIRLFSSDLVAVTATALTLASDLRDAVARDDIGVVVQPLVQLASGAVHSVEVLARWQHPDLGDVAPEAFFAAAERSGQTAALSLRVLDRALALCQEWSCAVRVAVNLAPRWLADPSLPEQIGQALARHGVPAHMLCLELTESSVIADPRRAVETLTRLRGMGVHLSVDDFGTGYSSLTYLSRLPVNQMKIDKSFVLRLHSSARDRAIARSIVDLGRNLGLEVVAEGVTDAGTRRALQEMGCAVAQGYLLAKPMDPAALPAYLAAHGVVPSAAAAIPSPLAGGVALGAEDIDTAPRSSSSDVA